MKSTVYFKVLIPWICEKVNFMNKSMKSGTFISATAGINLEFTTILALPRISRDIHFSFQYVKM